jgi:hypothetical protein
LQRGLALKEGSDDAIQANGAGLRLTHASMLPMQALAMAYWQFWSTTMAFYPRAWISASSRSPTIRNAMTVVADLQNTDAR